MSSHTPGPWHLATNRHPTTDGRQWGVVEAKRHPAGGAGQHPRGTTITWEGEEGKANARLIAAAPDLLEALVALRDLLQSENVRIEARDVDWFVADSIYEKADAAITNATDDERLRTLGHKRA